MLETISKKQFFTNAKNNFKQAQENLEVKAQSDFTRAIEVSHEKPMPTFVSLINNRMMLT